MGSASMGTQTPVLPGHPFRPFDLVHIRIHSDHSKLGQSASLQECMYQFAGLGIRPAGTSSVLCDSVYLRGSLGAIASEGSNIPRVHWIRVDRLCQVRDSVQGQSVFFCQSWVEIPQGVTPVIQIDQGKMAGVEEMMRQMQEAMKIMQEDAARQAEFAKQQAAIMAQQAELITRLQQQNGASASHQTPPPPRIPTLGETANVQEGTGIPTGPAPPLILPQLSKAPMLINQPDSPFEFEVDPTALKLNKLEKLFKKSQGVKSIPDIEDGFTDAAVTLPDRFKMPHIDRFDGSGDPMVHLSLFSDVLRPMGLTRLQKLSLFGRTLSGVAAIWYAKLEDSVKRSWEEMAEAFVA
ncbi:hypothetical protein ACSBR2_032644 [Camellia fascicularis]